MALSDEELLRKTDKELLDLLIEECAELIQAAVKAKRFGCYRMWPGYNGDRCNADAIIREGLQVNDTLRAYCAALSVRYGDALEWWVLRKDHDYVLPASPTASREEANGR